IADSCVQVGKDSFHVFRHDRFIMLDYERSDDAAYSKKLTNKDLFYLITRNKATMSMEQAQKHVSEIMHKYAPRYARDEYNYDVTSYDGIDNNTHLLRDEIRKKYLADEIHNNLYNVYRHKNNIRIPEDLDDFLRGIIYSALAVCLLLIAFRHSTVKLFFLSVITAVVLSFLIGFIVAALRFHEYGAFGIYMFVYFILLVLALSIHQSSSRSLIKGIALNGSMLGTFPIPLIVVAMFQKAARDAHYALYQGTDYLSGIEAHPFDYEKWRHYMFLAEIGGFVLLFGMLYFVFSKLYRCWYAQAEE
ncbi:MAG: hypothetical protein ACRCYO_20145, partial [Bacteroidia bacterium]